MATAAAATDKIKKPGDVAEGDKPIQEGSAAAEFLGSYLDKTKKAPKQTAEDDGGEKDKGGAGTTKPKPKPFAKSKPATAIDARELGEAIGESVARAIKPAKADADERPTKEQAEDDALFASPKEQRRLKVFAKMGENDPNYKDLAVKYKASKKKLADYAAKWQQEHPGETFDEEDEEHADFIESVNQGVDYDDEDFAEALADIKADEKAEAKSKPLVEKLSRFEQREKIAEARPKIEAAAFAAGNEFWKNLGDDFKDVVTEDGQINVEALNALKESDADTYAMAYSSARNLEAYAAEMYKLHAGLIGYDEKDPVHVKLVDFALACESDMLKKNKDEQLDNEGRQFVPRAKWNKLSPETRAEYWTYTSDQLNELLAREIAKATKKRLEAEEEKFQRRLKARGINSDGNKPSASRTRTEKSIEEIEAERDEDEGGDDDKPLSPESGGSPRMASAKKKGAQQEKSAAESWIEAALK